MIMDLIALNETIRFLHGSRKTRKVEIIHQQMQVCAVSGGNKKVYTPEILVRAFSYYAVSRSRTKTFQMPSISTLALITSSCTKKSSSEFLKTVFEHTENKPCTRQNDCPFELVRPTKVMPVYATVRESTVMFNQHVPLYIQKYLPIGDFSKGRTI